MAGIGVGMMVFGVFLMGVVQIAMFKSFPKFIRVLFSSNLLLGMIANFLLSSVILLFTGVGTLAGMSNLGGSVLFGIYLAKYKQIKNCRITVKWYLWIIPKVTFNENEHKHWLF